MIKRIVVLVLIILLSLLAAAACQPIQDEGNKSIVVTYSVLGSLVKELVGDQANVTFAIPNGQDPHEWEPSARDIETINKADLVIENGTGLEGGMEKTLDGARASGVRFFTASDHYEVRRVGPGEGIPSDDPDQQVGAPDPHPWTDPLTMKSVIAALAPVLRDLGLDVDARAKDLADRLDSLNTEVAGIVAQIPLEDRKLVTGHESMGYFAQRYGFKLVGVIIPSLSSQAGVSAGDLAELKETIQSNDVKAIFTELGTSPQVAEAIGQETGAKVVDLPAAYLPPDGSYFTFMKGLAGTIAEALK
jgi:zinc/manganese transport system substrate-binding protein